MATRFRLPSAGSPAVSPAFQTYSHANGVRRPLVTADSSALTTVAQTPDAADHLVAGDTSHLQLVSAPLDVQTFTVGDAFKFCLQGLEANAANNLQVQVWIGIVSNDGLTALATLRSKVLEGLELATALTSRFFSGTLSGGRTTTAGERLVVEFSVSGTPTAAGGVQGHNASLRGGANGAGGDLLEDDTQTGTTLNPWFEFTNTVLFQSTTFQQALAATGVAVASIGRVTTYSRTLAVTGIGVATMTTALAFGVTMVATGVGVASLTARLIIGQLLAAVGTGIATLAAQFIEGEGQSYGAFRRLLAMKIMRSLRR